MAFTSKDGQKFTNRVVAMQHDARMENAKPKNHLGRDVQEDNENNDDKKSILDDPHAMKLVDQLDSMGYDADDFKEACDAKYGSEDNDNDDEMSHASGMQLPGLMTK